MKKLILIDCDGVVLNWDDVFEWWIRQKYGILRDKVSSYTGGVYGRYKLSFQGHEKYSWMDLVAEFNSSDYAANLPPLRDSVKYIRYLHEEHGYVFQVVTSFSSHPYLQRKRRENLHRYFGNAIWGVDFADLCGPKNDLLKPYKDCGIPWVEDKLSNAELGMNLGLKSYLMMHQYNFSDAMNMDPAITPIGDWKEFVKKADIGLDTN